MAMWQNAFAYEFSAQAPSGQILYYNIVYGNAQVTYQSSSPRYTNLTGNLIIPDSVTRGSTTYAVTSINSYAFQDCSGLTSVTIPNGVTSIGQYAFSGVRHIEYHGNATGAPWGAFSMNGVIEDDLVYSDSTKHYLLSYIGTGANVSIPSTVYTIGGNAFRYCNSLTSVTIGSGVTSIGGNAFYGCNSLTSVVFNADSCTSVGSQFNWGAFYGCYNITDFTFGNNVKVVPDYLCYQLWNITNITIPDSVISIGTQAFQSCGRITSVTIGCRVSYIGSSAFGDCQNLDTVYMLPTIPPELGNAYVFGNNASGRVFILNGCSYDNYLTYNSSDNWSNYCYNLRDPIINIDVTVSSSNPNRGSPYISRLRNNDVRCDSTSVIYGGANNAYHFDHWSNGNTANPDTLQLTGDTSLTAYYIGLTVLSDNETMGSAWHTKIGNHLDKITADARSGYHFTHWNNGSTANPDTITLTGDSTVTAYFERNTYHLTAEVNDATHGSVSFPLSDSALYQDTLIVVATPAAHYHVASWQGRDIVAISEDKDTVWVEMNYDRTLTCNFAIDTHTVAVASSDITRGSVSGGGEFEYGQPCTVEATPYSGYTFAGWSDGSTFNPYTFAVTGDVELTAIFLAPGEESYTVTVSVNDPTMGTATVNSNATATVMSGTEVTLRATANNGHRFVRWNDNDTHAVRTVTVTADATYTAYFEALQGIDEIESSRVKIEVSGLAVTVDNPDGETVQIYDIAGRQLASSKLSIFNFQFSTSGVYIVKVGNLPARKIVVVK